MAPLFTGVNKILKGTVLVKFWKVFTSFVPRTNVTEFINAKSSLSIPKEAKKQNGQHVFGTAFNVTVKRTRKIVFFGDL